MEIPNHLRHTPIVKLEGYSDIANDEWADGLSVGIAQWNENGDTELSAKVWRYDSKNNKWSRQSEELPLHRVLDLASLICASISYAKDSTVPMKEKFNIDLRKDQNLLNTLTTEIMNNEHLDISLKRLSLYLKELGY